RAIAAHFVIDADVGNEAVVRAVDVIRDRRVGVGADAVDVLLPAQRDHVAFDRRVALYGAVAGRGAGPREGFEIRRLRTVLTAVARERIVDRRGRGTLAQRIQAVHVFDRAQH